MKKSHETKPKHKYAVLGALLVTATMSVQASAENNGTVPFTMTVISDGAHGTKVTSGKYEQAIDRITAGGRRSRDRFADQNNLCVAYTKTSEIEKAGAACNAAIAYAKRQASRVSENAWNYSAIKRAYRSDLAVALSNRGVLLAATGDTKLARQDFFAAIELQSGPSSIAENNLGRLEISNPPEAY